METTEGTSCTAFAGLQRIASGPPAEVADAARKAFERDGTVPILVFDDATAEQIDLDLSAGASTQEPPARTGTPSTEGPRGPGRPKLGVVAREVTLLPRHWEWLGSQPGGASVALRKLVEAARKANEGRDRQRRAQEAAYRFMSALAGNLPGFEEAIRALFAAEKARFDAHVEPWPPDVRDHARKLAAGAFATAAE